ncbi:MAG: hypothetical protein WCZ12_02195 [Patescibacteria group bacterium]
MTLPRDNLRSKKKTETKRRPSKKRKHSHPKAVSWHHILPRSRGGTDDESNKAKIILLHHRNFHGLFQNMTPHEVLAFVEVFFFQKEKFINDYYFNRESIYKGPENFIKKDSRLNSYHYLKFCSLFQGMNPFEILSYLEKYFWNKQEFWVNDYRENRDYYLDMIESL